MNFTPMSEGQRKLYLEEYGEEHPQPPEPEILPGNLEAAWIWSIVENQVIQLQSGHILGINMQAVIGICRELNMSEEKTIDTLGKIKLIESLSAYSWLKKIKKP